MTHNPPPARFPQAQGGKSGFSAATIAETQDAPSEGRKMRFATYADFMALAWPWVAQGSPDWKRGEIFWNAAREVKQ